MIQIVLKHIGQFIVLIALQVLVITNLELGRFINPFIYVLFIIVLPFNTPKWLLLISALALGLSVDMFYDTAGMHAAASVFMAFMRPWVLNIIAPRGGYELDQTPTVMSLGMTWFLSYSTLLLFFHHTVLFYTEVFHFGEFAATLTRIIVSTVFSLMLVIIGQYLFYRKKG